MENQIENAQVEYDIEEDNDGIGEGHGNVPKGWAIYYWATIAWMVYYVYAFTPMFSGWTQSAGLDKLAQ
jgi:hypothetical protein